MPIPDDVDQQKLAEMGLALLHLTTFSERSGTRAWKGLDWDLLNLLYERDWIHDPKGKAKSVVLTDEGARLGEELFRRYFAVSSSTSGRAV
jgi:hypothetical protein